MNIYLASSWRNERQPEILLELRAAGHDVYDFRNPAPDDDGFRWTEVDPNWKRWTPEQFITGLKHPIAAKGFANDWEAMLEADACVLLLPCGRSAHLEAGYFVGARKPLLILLDNAPHTYDDRPCEPCGDFDGCHGGLEPELMYKMAHGMYAELSYLISALELVDEELPGIRGGVTRDGQPTPVA